MNILPHKSWHVRTKKNIARVRKDEAQAAEEEKERQRRIALAAQEARTDFLRERASKRCQDVAKEFLPPTLPVEQVADIIQKDGHVNFFQDIEEGIQQKGKVNEEHEQEKKKEQEDYEKQIGYLTYLGQNSIEQTKQRPWYEKIDRSATVSSNNAKIASKLSEKSDDPTVALKEAKFKDFHDPLKDIRKYLTTPGIKAVIDKTLAKQSASLKRPREEGASSKPVRSAKRMKKSKAKKRKHKSKKHINRKHKSKHEKKDKDKRRKHKSKSTCSSPSSNSSGSDSEWETEEDSDSKEKLKQAKLAALRAERLEREREESRKAEKLMAKLRGEVVEEEKPPEKPMHPSGIKQKYNAQFNPHLARQNFEN